MIQEDSNSSLFMSLMHLMNEKSNYGSYTKLRYDMAFFIWLVISKYALKYSGLDSSIYSQKYQKYAPDATKLYQIFPREHAPAPPIKALYLWRLPSQHRPSRIWCLVNGELNTLTWLHGKIYIYIYAKFMFA